MSESTEARMTGRNPQFDREAGVRALGLEDALPELEEQGYVVIPPEKVAPPEFIERMTDALLAVIERRTGKPHSIDKNADKGYYTAEPDTPGQFLLYYLLFEDRVFEEWIMNPTLQALITYQLRELGRLSSLVSFVKSKGGRLGEGDSLGLHSDAPPDPTGSVHDDVCNAALILTDYKKEDGAIAMVPGSHRYGRYPKPGEGVAEAVPVEAPAGSLVFFKGNTWHGAFPKLTDGLRLNVTSYAASKFLKTQETYQRHITRAMLERNPIAFARFLGVADGLGWGAEGPKFSLAARWAECGDTIPPEVLERYG